MCRARVQENRKRKSVQESERFYGQREEIGGVQTILHFSGVEQRGEIVMGELTLWCCVCTKERLVEVVLECILD